VSTDAAEPELLVERTDRVVRLVLNRERRRNALSLALLRQLDDELGRLAADDTVHVVVIAANGPVFSSGHDLGEMPGRTEAEYRELFETCSRVMRRIRSLPQPVIARVQGLATAAGCQLVAACDLVVAAEGARFATPGVKIGLFCTTPMVPLVRSVAPKVALEMLLTGEPITAQRAYEVGLVNRVVPAGELDAEIARLCDTLAASSPLVLKTGKRAFYDQLALAEEAAYPRAVDVMTENVQWNDAQEGMTAFLEKRPPKWTGT
jgi:enoyl-CoA hydratase/carnithine racemase